MIEGAVTDRLRVTHGGVSQDAWRVEYRTTEQTGSTEDGRLRATLFVATDGLILSQQAYLFGSSIDFQRESDDNSRELAALLELKKYATINLDETETDAEAFSQTADRSDSEPGPGPLP